MTNSIVAVIAGLFIGGVVGVPRSGLGGALLGGLFGYLLHAVSHHRRRLDALQQVVGQLRRQEEAPAPADADARDDDIVDLVEPADELFIPIGQKPRPQVAAAPPPRDRLATSPPPARKTAVEEELQPEWLGRLLSGENLLVKVGVVILFLGVSFLVKYAAQHGLFPLELRLASAALGGCILVATGWRLRRERPVYAQVIQGGGIGILYLTTFASMRLYHLIPTAAGFALLVAICTLATILALMQDARPLAVLGSAGGFLAPELASIGSGSHVVLFGYYALLNTGITAIAWFRAWRSLNIVGFVCTFIVSASWGSRYYRPEYFATVEPFLLLFFLIYTGVAILLAVRRPAGIREYPDATLIFGTPLAAFFLQSGLVQRFEFGLAWSAFAAGFFYLALVGILILRREERLHPLCDVFLAFGVVFVTLAIPLAFNGRWTAAVWCVEGAAIVWAGLRQERQLARGFGHFLLIGAGAAFLAEVSMPTGTLPVLNGFYLGSLLVSGAPLFAARFLCRQRHMLAPWEGGMEQLLFAWGMLWWLAGGLHEIDRHILPDFDLGGYLGFVALSCGASHFLRRRLAWPLLDYPALGLLPAMAVFAAFLLPGGTEHPLARGCYLAWPAAFAIHYLILSPRDDERPALLPLLHAGALWLLAWLAAWEISWQTAHILPNMSTWAMTVWGVVPAGLALLITLRGRSLPWPVGRHLGTYLGLGSGPLVLFGWLWAIGVNLTEAGTPWPLPYLPLANPLEATTLLVLVTMAAWHLRVEAALPQVAAGLPRGPLQAGFAATCFLCLNAMLLRTIHHWGGVPFTAHALFSSTLVQAALSIFWSMLALVTMTVATRRGLRTAWLAGAGLLGTVVGKLFLVDLASSGSVERIVSFVVVGILVLVIGWFAPVPPRTVRHGEQNAITPTKPSQKG